MDEKQKKTFENIVTNEFPQFEKMLEGCMNLNQWGFKKTFIGITSEFPPSIIYDSDYCRVRFMWHLPDKYEYHETISIFYGRRHALNDHMIIKWKEKKCLGWYEVDNLLNYLDGLSPHEAVERKFKRTLFMEQFEESNKGNNWSQPEWLARMHTAIWEQYGQRLFDLLDIRRPDLWEKYTKFVREFYKLKPSTFHNYPYPEDIC